jgi:arabinofuranan 3-O-arabinosyltransferase
MPRPLRTHWRLWLLVALSYVPLLTLRTGRINADTKLYLGEDPSGLIARSLFAWDSSQFGGFVPHQAIAYLWPSGPFYWFFDLLGSPQWLTQRMWVGTIFFTAAWGVYVLLRHLAFSLNASLMSAVFFMSSPYVLAYQSRTSSMLLPWAAIAWLGYFTSRGIASRSWLWPSLIALTMFTVGSVNATATLLILPAALLIALFQYTRSTSFGALAAFSAKTTFLTVGVSLWWAVMLYIQARYGAKLLSYSETLESVASTSHSFEVLRGFGYWLNYVGLDSLPLTTGALRVFTSGVAMTAGVVLVILAVGSLALSHHPHRRLSLWLILVGTILSVGVYPLNDASPLFSALADNPTSTLSLAFRSSTRAIPILLLGMSMGLAVMYDNRTLTAAHARTLRILARLRITPRALSLAIPLCVVALIGLANPTRYTSGSFEPTLERSPIPESWHNFAHTIDNPSEPATRVVQLPGQEFGAYTWGYTVDPALPAVSDTPLLTRDLIPLGNESMMNLLWATDEAFREGRLHPNALQSLARVLSTRTFFFPGDLDNERHGTPSQEESLKANQLIQVAQGVPGSPGSHQFIGYESTEGAIIRQQASSVLLLGDGKGVVDASIAGLIQNDSIFYAGHLSDADLSNGTNRFRHVVVTDTNTEKAQHWRSSSDTLGFDENREGDLVNFGTDSGDIRMRIFPTQRSEDKSWFEQVGPVRVRASSYGPPLSYRPEHRPFAAIDNNPATAWTVAHGVTPIAPVIQLLSEETIDTITLTQPRDDINRRISQISVSVDDQPWVEYSLTQASLTRGETITLPTSGTAITIRIDAITPTRKLRTNEELSGVGFSEIVTQSSATQEIGVLPTRGLENLSPDTPLSYVLTRRVAPRAQETRSDIEFSFARSIYVPRAQQMNITVRFDTSDFSDTEVTQLQQRFTSQSLLRINGNTINFSALTPTGDGALHTTINTVAFSAGTHLVETTDDQYPIDQIVISNLTPTSSDSAMLPQVTESQLVRKTLQLQPCPSGCWLILGEGHSPGWKATVEGVNLGSSTIVDGGSNGWWIEPTTNTQRATLSFAPQKQLTIALIISAVFVLAAISMAFLLRRARRDPTSPITNAPPFSYAWKHVGVVALNTVLMTALLDAPTALWTSAVVALALWIRAQRLFLWLTTLVFISTMTASWYESLTTQAPLDFGWPASTQASHHTLLVCLALLGSLSLTRTTSATSRANDIK